MIISSLDPAGTPEETLAKCRRQFRKLSPEDAPMMSANCMNYFPDAGQMDKFAETAAGYYDKYGSESSMELNNIAWVAYENIRCQNAGKGGQMGGAIGRNGGWLLQ